MRIVIASVQEPFVRGGAEILAEDLCAALIAAGHEAEIVAIPWKAFPTRHLLDHLLAFRLLDLTEGQGVPIDRLIALKFPAYLIPHPAKSLWLVHQHRAAYDLWDDPYGLSRVPAGAHARAAVRRADLRAFGEARKVLTISRNVSSRLRQHLGCDSTPVYPPPRNAAKMYSARDEGYFFFPGRIAPLKRHRLVVEALARTRHPVRLVLTGTFASSDDEREIPELATRLGCAERIEWLGWLSAGELIERYAHCRAVVFPPQDEDYGYVTLEAMLASKPVLTCSDSGGTLEFVVHRETGLVVRPEPAPMAAAMDELWEARERARAWGEAGRQRYEDLGIGWSRVLDGLLA